MSSEKGGTGILGVLGIVFITLKLMNIIDWSWWWVTAPFWGGFAVVAILMILGFLLVFLAEQWGRR